MEIIPKVSNSVIIKSGDIELEIHESDREIIVRDLNMNCDIEYPEVLIKGDALHTEFKSHSSVKFAISEKSE